MPEQGSRRGDAVTHVQFTGPFETPLTPFGMGGLNLAVAIDQVPQNQFARLYDVQWIPGDVRALTGRLGYTNTGVSVPPISVAVHSLVRMNDSQTGASTLFAGNGTLLSRVASNILTPVEGGFSGQPLTLLPHRPPISSDPWLFVGDTAKMRQVRFDGLALPIGLPAPGSAPSVAPQAIVKTQIANFSSDGTAPADWTINPGFTYDDPPEQLPPGEVIPIGFPPSGTPSIQFGIFSLRPDYFLPKGGYGFFGVPITRNLSVIGARPATDDDIIHLWLYMTSTLQVREFRLYFVCSETFSASVLPGQANEDGANGDFYVKAFNGNDFSGFMEALLTQTESAELQRVRDIRDANLTDRRFLRRLGNPSATTEATLAARDPGRATSIAGPPGSETWQEFGIIGLPVRRGEWQRVGNTSGRDWSTITGLVVFVRSGDASGTVGVAMSDLYLTGGNGPDTSEPDAVPYDYRYTHYDPRTGDEGNPSPVMSESLWVDALRQAINVTPAAASDAAIRQRVYRRGGTRTSNWDFLGQNTLNGGTFIDRASDAEASGGGTLQTDHYQPVPTVDDSGNAILAQPVPVIFGPYQGQLYALGDPYRPGYVYACIPGESGNWPPDLAHEVSAPSEALQTGLMWGGQPFVASTLRWYTLYPNLNENGQMTSAPSGCTQGLASRWSWCVGAGAIWGVSTTCVYRTSGGPETIVSQKIEPLFRGQTVNGYAPISFAVADLPYLRLAVWRDELYFQYRDTQGATRVQVLQILTGEWRTERPAMPTAGLYPDVEPTGTGLLLVGGATSGKIYQRSGTSDDGAAITPLVRTGAQDFGRPREEKLFGDQILDVIGNDLEVTLQNWLNSETVENPPIATTIAGAQRTRMIYDGFGAAAKGPQRARNVSTEISWNSAATSAILYFLGTSLTFQPDLTINRVTNWDDLGHPDQKYVTGVTFDCDTGGEDRTILIERDWNGEFFTVATLTVNADGRHKLPFSWPAAVANQVRIRPVNECGPWLLYRADWIFQPEPPRIAGWDIYFENGWDQYLTGVDLFCNTEGATKRIVVEVDGTALVNPATSQAFWDISANGRQVVHLTLPWTRGHVLHLYATDTHVGQLFEHRWHTESEPSEQANWNQPFTIMGTQADKYVKAVILEIDTFGATKTIQMQADEHEAVRTFTVNTTGRKVVQVAFPQFLARVVRIWPTDANPSRLYSARPVFDEEPFQLDRWETQYIDHGIKTFHQLIDAMITLKSTSAVTLTINTMINQTGTIKTDTYTIPSTAGEKVKRFVPFVSRKGVLYKYTFTADTAFWLYGAESQVTIQPWQGGGTVLRQPFGDDDADPTREMVNSTLAAGRSGGAQ